MDRQEDIWDWTVDMFGDAANHSGVERGLRVLEEAAELAQSLGVTRMQASSVMTHVWSRQPGDPDRELPQVQITLEAAAEYLGLHLGDQTDLEWGKLLKVSREKMRESHKRKLKAGICDLPLPQEKE